MGWRGLGAGFQELLGVTAKRALCLLRKAPDRHFGAIGMGLEGPVVELDLTQFSYGGSVSRFFVGLSCCSAFGGCGEFQVDQLYWASVWGGEGILCSKPALPRVGASTRLSPHTNTTRLFRQHASPTHRRLAHRNAGGLPACPRQRRGAAALLPPQAHSHRCCPIFRTATRAG